jgi:hypothetical protein
MAKQDVVRLSAADRTLLTDLITADKSAARAQPHARMSGRQGPRSKRA